MAQRGRKSAASLSVVRPDGPPPELPHGMVAPPRPLDAAGRALWDAICRDYQITTSADVELLALACEATDRAESCRARIALDGIMVDGKEHPLLKHELNNRAFVTRALQRLGLES